MHGYSYLTKSLDPGVLLNQIKRAQPCLFSKKMPSFTHILVYCFVWNCHGSHSFAQSTVIVKWGTQASTDTDGNSLLRYNDVFYDITAAGTPYQKLLDLNDGTLDSSGSTGLVELGFDTDSSATYAPNVDASNPFVGEWTP